MYTAEESSERAILACTTKYSFQKAGTAQPMQSALSFRDRTIPGVRARIVQLGDEPPKIDWTNAVTVYRCLPLFVGLVADSYAKHGCYRNVELEFDGGERKKETMMLTEWDGVIRHVRSTRNAARSQRTFSNLTRQGFPAL